MDEIPSKESAREIARKIVDVDLAASIMALRAWLTGCKTRLVGWPITSPAVRPSH